MDHAELQRFLARQGYYHGEIDGKFWDVSKKAAIACLTAGPDYELTDSDVAQAARDLKVEPYKIWASWETESTGTPFVNGIATILFEPHRFSRATGHRYDASHPRISSRKWNKKLYPGSQQGRWDQLMSAVELNVDAGFASASYGGFQILGENFAVCDAANPFAFAWRQCQTEGDQLDAFVHFVKGNKLDDELRACKPGDAESCRPFARGYNGTAYAVNGYHETFASSLTKMKARHP